jgi:kynureninase
MLKSKSKTPNNLPTDLPITSSQTGLLRNSREFLVIKFPTEFMNVPQKPTTLQLVHSLRPKTGEPKAL